MQVISDLLKPAQRELVIREDPRRGKYVHGLSEWVVRSPAEVLPPMLESVRILPCLQLNPVSFQDHSTTAFADGLRARLHYGLGIKGLRSLFPST